MKKITSKNGFTFLFEEIPHERRNKLGIANGESVLLSVYENDIFMFSNDINLIKYENIVKTENPTNLEIEFFNMVKQEKEIKYRKSLVDQYEITKYVHFLPRVSFKQETISKDKLEITGTIRYLESIYEKEVPIVSIDGLVLTIDSNSQFKFDLSPIPNKGDKIKFTFDLPKQLITRSYEIK
ncbi:hypothetical protein [Enterococcus gilvus]|uniref:Uncharacterized protein n=1 Tax=Enterococcus gilvus ATCC BAA-350 TaxID=1158614 RepID=R2XS88_9ENTE|nr:hypothetical protein [Enterococcus gilvus]EOI57388.1 hypothetical protein UKC_01604 [Enterococcus gilvus ATCC BAA-350]EOW83038.1 hypothetical protein I592_02363 [Enterococcus gilvus ATCC BAA-350]OJG41075.1 hypothetical protein RV02_GL001291 [Enterococcus gilvus]